MTNLLIGVVIGLLVASTGWGCYVWHLHGDVADMRSRWDERTAINEKLSQELVRKDYLAKELAKELDRAKQASPHPLGGTGSETGVTRSRQ